MPTEVETCEIRLSECGPPRVKTGDQPGSTRDWNSRYVGKKTIQLHVFSGAAFLLLIIKETLLEPENI